VAYHHVESFNFAFGPALERAINYLPPLELVFPPELRQRIGIQRMMVWVETLHLEKPCKEGNAFS